MDVDLSNVWSGIAVIIIIFIAILFYIDNQNNKDNNKLNFN